MSSPADQDLGAFHAEREAELERQQILEWAQQRAGMVPNAGQAEAPVNPTPQLQDPSSPAPPQQGVTPGDVARDIGRGALEAPRQALGGAVDALKETSKFLQWVNGPELTAASGGKPLAQQIPDVGEPASTTGGLVRGVSHFLTAFAGAGKIGAVQKIAEALPVAGPLLQGALAQFAAFDPAQERLSNLVQEHPALANPVTEYLQADPNDSEAEGRFKSALEGLGLGAATEGLLRGVKAVRSVALAKQAAGVTDEAASGALKQAASQQTELAARIGDPAQPALAFKPPELAKAPEMAAAQGADQPGQVFINTARIDSHDDVKAMIQELADARAGNIDTARRGVRSWEATRLDAAQKDAWEVLQARKAGAPLNAEETFAVRELWVRSGARVHELAQAVATNGGELDQIAFRKALLVHNAIQEQVIGARTETARALNAWRMPAGDTPAFAGQMEQLRALAQSDGRDLRDIATRLVSAGDAGLAREADAFVEASALAKGRAAIRQAWYGALLSNPKTLVRNVTGNTSNLLLNFPETQVASWIARAAGDDSIPSGEAMQRLFGMIQGYKDAWIMSAKSRQVFEHALSTVGDDPEAARALFAEDAAQRAGSSVLEAQGGVRPYEIGLGGAFDPEKWGAGRTSIPGRFLAFVDSATTASTRALQRTDELFKGMAYNMELRAQVYRQAHQELESGAIEKSAFADRLAEILASPTDSMRLAARTNAEVQTFTNPPKDTPLWGFIQKWHRVPVFGDITMPFARTPYNIATQTMQRTPLSPFMKSWREDILAGGARGHQAWSRFVVGNTILLTAADLAMNGALTGQGPSDPAAKATLKRQGWQPWSVKVGDRYFDYRSIDPIGPLIGLAANTVDILKSKDFGQADENGRFEQLAIATSMSIAAQVTNQSFMTGAASFFDAIQDPQRYGEKWWQQLATSALIPRGVAALERITDPTQRVAWDIGSAIRSQTPGLSADLPPARNLWGDPITTGSGYGPWYDLLSPFQSSKENAQPIDAELSRLEHWVASAPRKLSFGGVSLDLTSDPKAYSRFVELAGNGAKVEGMGLRDKLNALVQGKDDSSDAYQALTDGPDGSKAMMLDRYVQGYREAAKAQLLDEFPELRAKLDQRRQEKQEALTPR